MDLQHFLDTLRRRWLVAVVVLVATVAVAAIVTVSMTPKYTATTRLFFAVQGGESVTDLAQGSTFAENQMSSYAEVATSPLVLDRVIKDLNLGASAADLAKNVHATTPPNTVILEIAVTNHNPQQSARVANAIGKEVTAVAGELSPERQDGKQSVRATTLAPAIAPAKPSSPLPLRNVALAVLLGVILGLAVALLWHRLDTKIRNERDVPALTDRPVLGLIPYDSSAERQPVTMHDNPVAARSEAVRRLRTNLQFVDIARDTKSIVISSSIPGEGKTTTAVNLAVSLADAGHRVALVDADLRRPAIADYLGLEGNVGLTTVLIGKASLTEVVQPWQNSALDVLPAGQIPPNPSELLGSPAMSSLLLELSTTYDIVLLDSPPLLPATDAAILSKSAGGVVLVVGADRVHRTQVRDALGALETVGATVFGLVLNKISRRDASPYIYQTAYAPDHRAPTPAAEEEPRRTVYDHN